MAAIPLELLMPFVNATEAVFHAAQCPLQRTGTQRSDLVALHEGLTVVVGFSGSIQGSFILQLEVPGDVPWKRAQAIVLAAQRALEHTRYRFVPTHPVQFNGPVRTLCQGGGASQTVYFDSSDGKCHMALHVV